MADKSITETLLASALPAAASAAWVWDPDLVAAHNRLADTTEVLKSAGLKIKFEPFQDTIKEEASIPFVEFKAFITKFKDSHTSKWETTDKTEGHGDMIHRQGATGRILTFSFDVPALSLSEAILNLNNLTTLAQATMPQYTAASDEQGGGDAEPTLWRINFANLIKNFVGIVESFAVTPNFEAGVFANRATSDADVELMLYPQLFSVDISCKYQMDVSFNKKTGLRGPNNADYNNYPYGVKGSMLSGLANRKAPSGPSPSTTNPPTTTGDADQQTDGGLGQSSDPQRQEVVMKKVPNACPGGKNGSLLLIDGVARMKKNKKGISVPDYNCGD